MFQSNDAGAQPPTLPPAHSANADSHEPEREQVRCVLYGSLRGLDRSIKHLHLLRYAEPNDWSKPLPSGRGSEWMVITTKHLLIE